MVCCFLKKHPLTIFGQIINCFFFKLLLLKNKKCDNKMHFTHPSLCPMGLLLKFCGNIHFKHSLKLPTKTCTVFSEVTFALRHKSKCSVASLTFSSMVWFLSERTERALEAFTHTIRWAAALLSLICRGGATTAVYMRLNINIITKSASATWPCGLWYGKASEMAEKPIYSL